MSREKRKATSEEMQNKALLIKRTGGALGYDENMDKKNWKLMRKATNLGYKLSNKEKDVKLSKVKLNKTKAILAYNKRATIDESHIIVYIHGGGFVTGSTKAASSYCTRLAKYSNFLVYSIDYSLAPENPYPKAFKECVNALDSLFEKYPNSKFSLVGESAGGNLCLAVALMVKKTGKITSVIVHSPLVDLSGLYDRSGRDLEDYMVKPGIVEALRKIYVKENSTKDPYISPIYGDYEDFPDTFITCDTKETLYEDSIALYEKCKAKKVRVKLIEMENSYHAFAASSTNAPEIKEILEETITFMSESLKGKKKEPA